MDIVLNSDELFLRLQSNLKIAEHMHAVAIFNNYDLFSYVKNSFRSGTYYGIT